MTDKHIINGKECRYWFRPNPSDYRKCSLRGENDNCDKIKDCFVKELLGKLALKEQECEKLHERTSSIIYNLTGGRLSYSTCTLEACEQAYRDQLDIDVEKATRELQTDVDKYKQALGEIEKLISEEVILWDEVDRMTTQVLNIINKVKEK